MWNCILDRQLEPDLICFWFPLFGCITVVVGVVVVPAAVVLLVAERPLVVPVVDVVANSMAAVVVETYDDELVEVHP